MGKSNVARHRVSIETIRRVNEEMIQRNKKGIEKPITNTYIQNLTAADINDAFKRTMERLKNDPQRQAREKSQQEMIASLLLASKE